MKEKSPTRRHFLLRTGIASGAILGHSAFDPPGAVAGAPSVAAVTAILLALTLAVCASGNASAREISHTTETVASPAVLSGSVPTAVVRNEAQLLRPLKPGRQMRITVILLPPRRAELQQLAEEITDPRSPRFRQFLTYGQWKAAYAPTDESMGVVADWARRSGLREIYRFPTNTGIVLQGSVGAVQDALRLQLSEYEFGGHHLFANNRRPSLPPSVAARVDTILGLNSVEQVHAVSEGTSLIDMAAPQAPVDGPFLSRINARGDAGARPPAGARRSLVPAITGPLGGNVIEPPDLWSSQAYDFNALSKLDHCCNPKNFAAGSPKEMSIAIVGENYPNQNDYVQFFTLYDLAYNVSELRINGSSCCNQEMTIDISWAGAMSNSFGSGQQTAHLFVYEGSGTLTNDYITAFSAALADDNARILSTSFGDYENYYQNVGNPSISAFRDITTAMQAIGWTLVAAAGDHGAYDDCKTLSVDYPASDTAVIAVGGTTINLLPAGAFKGETAWSGVGCIAPVSNRGGGGGGCSNTFFAPWWSSPLGQCPGGRRALPDMSLNAGSFQALFFGNWISVGGTSIGAPELAGFFAQAASYLAFLELSGETCGNGPTVHCVPIGHPGPALYQAGPRPFYDVNDGSCNGSGVGPGYCTTAGFDKATGFGSANMLQLAWALNKWIGGPGSQAPTVVFQGPGTGVWFPTDQTISFAVTGGTLGIAGYTAQWDHDPGDPVDATPGSGDPYWDGPAMPFGIHGSLSLAAAGVGCHTAYVRAWSNMGVVSTDAVSYGPICFGAPPQCSIGFSCPTQSYNPPAFTVQCPGQADFYETYPDGTKTALGTATNWTGTATLYNDDVLACDVGTNNCIGFSIFANVPQWCGSPNPPSPPGPNPSVNCRACTAAGGYCNADHKCVFQ